MRGVPCDKDGIPILSRTDIEERAEDFVRFFAPTCLSRPTFTPLLEIADRLDADYGVVFRFDVDLGYSPGGDKLLGRFHVATQTIFVDAGIDSEDPRFHFTLAHELAHFVMHREVPPGVTEDEGDPVFTDTRRQLYLDRLDRGNTRGWMEWQANCFAASMLLPRATVPEAVVRVQQEMGIVRSLGQIYLDDQPANARDLQKLLRGLQGIFRVSRSAIKIRLRELNILIERRASMSRVSDILFGR